MKSRTSSPVVLKQKVRYLLTLVLMCLFSLSWAAQGPNQQKRLRQVTGLLVGQATEGARVTVLADSMLDDYEAFRRGDRFYIRIPATEFTGMQPSFHGDGFDDVQLQKVGDSVVISFKLQPGASARVDGGSNRLEVIFFSPSRMASVNNANANAVRSRVTRNPARGATSATGYTTKRGADAAGPMPPDSPGYTPRNVQDSPSSADPLSGTASNSRDRNQREPKLTIATSADTAVQSHTPNQTATPYPTSQYSPTNAPLSPASTPVAQTPTPTAANTVWLNRFQRVRQWASVNKMAVSIGGVAILALVGVMVFVLYRKRRAQEVRLNAPKVQPRYSSDVELEDMLASLGSDDSTKVAPGPYVDGDTYEHWEEGSMGGETVTERQGEANYNLATYDDFSSIKDEPWEFVEATPNAQVYQGRVQEEREVFEL